jgi:hypothetical protein
MNMITIIPEKLKILFNLCIGVVLSCIILSSRFMHRIDLFSDIIITLIIAYATLHALPICINGNWKLYAPKLRHRIVFTMLSG